MALLPRLTLGASTNYADITAPTYTSSVIPAGGTTLVDTYNENISSTITTTTGRSITMSGGAVTLSAPVASGVTVTWTLSRTVNSGETCSANAYTAPGTGIKDLAGNYLATFSGRQTDLGNNSTQGAVATNFVTGWGGGYEGSGGDALEAGYKFTIGGANIDLTHLGFRRHSATYADRVVTVRNDAGTTIASATVSYTDAAVDSDCFFELASPVTLTASTAYHITTARNSGGNYNGMWGASGLALSTTAVATVNTFTNESQNNSYGYMYMVTFKYTT